MEEGKKCPKCGIINLQYAEKCDCGYDFAHPKNAEGISKEPPSPIQRVLTVIGLCLAMSALNVVTSLPKFGPGLFVLFGIVGLLWGTILAYLTRNSQIAASVGLGAYLTSVIFILVARLADSGGIINLGDMGRHYLHTEIWYDHVHPVSLIVNFFLLYRKWWKPFHQRFAQGKN